MQILVPKKTGECEECFEKKISKKAQKIAFYGHFKHRKNSCATLYIFCLTWKILLFILFFCIVTKCPPQK